MFRGRKNKWTQFRFRFLQKQHVQKTFQALYVKSGYMPNEAIFIATHSSWWDPLILFELEQKKQTPSIHTMINEALFKKDKIFSNNGAFPVQLATDEEAIKAFQYADLLLTEGQSVALFPQGHIQQQDERPITLQPSLLRLLTLCRDVPIIPTTMYYTYRDKQKAEVWVSFGDPIYQEHTPVHKTSMLEKILTAQLDELRLDAIRNATDRYKNVLHV